MKTLLIPSLLLGVAVLNAQATLFGSGTLNAAIPDNNPSGYVSSIAVSGLGPQLQTLSLNLNLSGGYNGDLYGYVVGPNGQMTVLLNRLGTGGANTYGYGDAGLNLALNDTGTAGLHNYQTVSGYATLISNGSSWQPDSGGVTFASRYGNSDPNGRWFLFLADLAAGDQSTLVNWSLDIVAVPEPANLALSVLGGLLAGGFGVRFACRRLVRL